jgi:hypothetical protein
MHIIYKKKNTSAKNRKSGRILSNIQQQKQAIVSFILFFVFLFQKVI